MYKGVPTAALCRAISQLLLTSTSLIREELATHRTMRQREWRRPCRSCIHPQRKCSSVWWMEDAGDPTSATPTAVAVEHPPAAHLNSYAECDVDDLLAGVEGDVAGSSCGGKRQDGAGEVAPRKAQGHRGHEGWEDDQHREGGGNGQHFDDGWEGYWVGRRRLRNRGRDCMGW